MINFFIFLWKVLAGITSFACSDDEWIAKIIIIVLDALADHVFKDKK